MFFSKNEEDKAKLVNEVLSKDSFDKLNIELIDIDLKIEFGNSFEIHYRGPLDEKPSVEFKNDVLEVKEPKVDHNHGKFWKKGFIEVNIVSHNDSGNLVVTVPDGHHLSEIKTTTVSGDTDIKNLIVDSLAVFAVSGDINLNKVQSDEVKLTTTSGDIDLKKVAVRQGKVKLTSGDFKIEDSTVFDELKVSTTSGDNLVKDVKAAQYRLSTLSGDNSLFGKNRSTEKVNSGNSEGTIVLSTLSGDNTVK